MSGKKEDIQATYICGQCRQEIFYLTSEEPPVPCPECGYHHKTRRVNDVPPETKVDINQL